jgi:hypothetical protein
MRNKPTYYIRVLAVDGDEIFAFTDEADLTNFIMDIEDHVITMCLSYLE